MEDLFFVLLKQKSNNFVLYQNKLQLHNERKKMSKQVGIVGVDGERMNNFPKIKDVNHCGSQVLVELLTAQEALGTILSNPPKEFNLCNSIFNLSN